MGRVSEYLGRTISPYDDDEVVAAADYLAPAFAGQPEVVTFAFEPGNGTRLMMIFTPLDRDAEQALGNTWLLTVNNRSYPADVLGYYTPDYLMEKWHLTLADAVPASAFLVALRDRVRALRLTSLHHPEVDLLRIDPLRATPREVGMLKRDLDRHRSDWIDLVDRLDKAERALIDEARGNTNHQEHLRLIAKARGVALARDYLRAYGWATTEPAEES